MDELDQVITDIKSSARKYRELTGKPLGITGEIAEYEAARLLGLLLMPAQTKGYDAKRIEPDGSITRLQIKARCVGVKPISGQRLGRLNLADEEWDAVLMVLMDDDFEVLEIREAHRPEIVQKLNSKGPGTTGIHRGLHVSAFKKISHIVWERPKGIP